MKLDMSIKRAGDDLNDETLNREKRSKDSVVKAYKKALKRVLKEDDDHQDDEKGNEKIEKYNLIIEELKKEILNLEDEEVKEIFDITCGHSRFLEIILIEKQKQQQEIKIKELLINTIYLCLERNTSLCKLELIAILLSSYGATLSSVDQKILFLIKFLEKQKLNLFQFHPYIFGSLACEYYSVKKDIKQTLIRQPKINEILSLYEKNLLLKTLDNFPYELNLIQEKFDDDNSNDDCQQLINEQIYDPRYFLTSFYHLLSNENLVNVRDFIALKGLSLTIAGLSSKNVEMRSLAYSILSRLKFHLEDSVHFENQTIWLEYLQIIRNTISEENERLSILITRFLVRIIPILINANDDLFSYIKEFLLKNLNSLSVNCIIEFCSKLLQSIETAYKVYFHKWSLNLLADGLRELNDLEIFIETKLFNNILIYYSSPLIVNTSKLDLLRVLLVLMKEKKILMKIFSKKSFLLWLQVNLNELLFTSTSSNNNNNDRNINIENEKIKIFDEILKNIGDIILVNEEKHLPYATFIYEVLLLFNTFFSVIVENEKFPNVYLLNILKFFNSQIKFSVDDDNRKLRLNVIYSSSNLITMSKCLEKIESLFNEKNNDVIKKSDDDDGDEKLLKKVKKLVKKYFDYYNNCYNYKNNFLISNLNSNCQKIL